MKIKKNKEKKNLAQHQSYDVGYGAQDPCGAVMSAT